ncbi:MAG: hypothetical protein JSV44_12485 [Candidatus Zixiibacteriota bacterium]|nr:MAG: hypothetical protein JSV44_12485 [candidate division Zixibacteria bacterium]
MIHTDLFDGEKTLVNGRTTPELLSKILNPGRKNELGNVMRNKVRREKQT